MCSNPIIKFDSENEKVRNDLIKYLNKFGVKQGHIAKLCSVSNCTISLFLSSKRMLVPDKLEIIKSIVGD